MVKYLKCGTDLGPAEAICPLCGTRTEKLPEEIKTISEKDLMIWNSIRDIATRFPRHSMDLFIYAQERNKHAFLTQIEQIKKDVADLDRLSKIV